MHLEADNLQLVLILTFGFATAALLGYISQKLKLSPILGYLVAGYIIGPFSPGFVADLKIAEQLAEIGVILMMFGVGMHFELKDLLHVKNIAIPGAILQTAGSAIAGAFFIHHLGWSIEAGILVGLAIGVASTVVLIRVLSDNSLLHTPQGHIAVGWLIVEDILTVIVLLMLPVLTQASTSASISYTDLMFAVIVSIAKFVILGLVMFTLGVKLVRSLFTMIARTRSSELFTLAVLAIIFVITTLSAYLFGASIALGAFIAGMVIAETDARHQASINSLPLKEMFVVLFFLSVGMLFNPAAIGEHTALFLGLLSIVLILKPLIAFVIGAAFGYPFKVSLTIALALGQIGEFSFILAEEALKLNLIADELYDVLVACALVSISLNPLLFKLIAPLSRAIDKLLQRQEPPPSTHLDNSHQGYGIIVGFGPIGQRAAKFLKDRKLIPIVIDQNIDTVARLLKEKEMAVYGDALQSKILEIAHLKEAKILIITAPELEANLAVIKSARSLNPDIKIIARANYMTDREKLMEEKVDFVCSEEESIAAFNHKLHAAAF